MHSHVDRFYIKRAVAQPAEHVISSRRQNGRNKASPAVTIASCGKRIVRRRLEHVGVKNRNA